MPHAALFRDKPSLDSFNVMKALVILGLPFVHIIENYYYSGVVGDAFYPTASLIVALTMFGPGVFMICMGLGLAKSKSYKRIRKMGVQMLIISLVLNILHMSLTDALLLLFGRKDLLVFITNILCSDIYTFVGLFFIAYSLIKDAGVSNRGLFFIAAAAFVADTLASGFIDLGNSLAGIILGNFISCGSFSFFPLLGWAIYPCVGIALEERVLSLPSRQRMGRFALIALIALACLILICSWAQLCGDGVLRLVVDNVAYCKRSFPSVFLQLSFAIFLLSAFHLLFQIIPANRLESFLVSFSSLLFPFYLLQWLFVSVVAWHIPNILSLFGITVVLNGALYLPLALGVLAASLFVTLKWGYSFSRWVFKISDYTKLFTSKSQPKSQPTPPRPDGSRPCSR